MVCLIFQVLLVSCSYIFLNVFFSITHQVEVAFNYLGLWLLKFVLNLNTTCILGITIDTVISKSTQVGLQ